MQNTEEAALLTPQGDSTRPPPPHHHRLQPVPQVTPGEKAQKRESSRGDG